ncbi:hypothetical protein F4804DRAFT_303271 [Jackrogersella minutella]|nr:hypothetical protein F4804DRAFT_303271 [Jackrogersella minutella]
MSASARPPTQGDCDSVLDTGHWTGPKQFVPRLANPRAAFRRTSYPNSRPGNRGHVGCNAGVRNPKSLNPREPKDNDVLRKRARRSAAAAISVQSYDIVRPPGFWGTLDPSRFSLPRPVVEHATACIPCSRTMRCGFFDLVLDPAFCNPFPLLFSFFFSYAHTTVLRPGTLVLTLSPGLTYKADGERGGACVCYMHRSGQCELRKFTARRCPQAARSCSVTRCRFSKGAAPPIESYGFGGLYQRRAMERQRGRRESFWAVMLHDIRSAAIFSSAIIGLVGW